MCVHWHGMPAAAYHEQHPAAGDIVAATAGLHAEVTTIPASS